MLGGIVERDSSAAAPPKAPRASTSGFPTILHRSQRPKRTLAQVAIPPAVASSETTSTDDASNRSIQSSQDARQNEGVPSTSQIGPSRLSSVGGATEYERIQVQVDDENRSIMEGMTKDEREEEIRELEERFGSGMMAMLRKRAESKANKGKQRETGVGSTEAVPGKQVWPETTADAVSSDSVLKERPESPPTRRKSVRFTKKHDRSPSDLKTYYPSEAVESDKLAWMSSSAAPSASTSSKTVRFDLSGTMLSSADQRNLPSHLGLHHHGDEPDLAGYSVDEILWLARSTVVGQRTTMLGVITKIIANYILTEDTTSTESVIKFREAWLAMDGSGKALSLGLDIIETSRNATLLQVGIELVYTSLGGPAWTCLHHRGASTDSFRMSVDAGGRAASIDHVNWEVMTGRILDLLITPYLIQPISIQQILLILRRAARQSLDTAEQILPITPQIVQHLLLRKPWPSNPSADRPYIESLRLLRDVTASSRHSAAEVVSSGLYESLLRFCIPSTWQNDSELGHDLCVELLPTYTCLARYGLLAGTARTAQEVFAGLGRSIGAEKVIELAHGSGVTEICAGYLELMKWWITCAIDPHRTTPEHDLTWTQVEAMGWHEEATSLAQSVMLHWNQDGLVNGMQEEDGDGDPYSWRLGVLESSLELLVAWSKGLEINGIKKGFEARKELAVQLDLLDEVASTILDSSDSRREAGYRVLLAAHQLQDLEAANLSDRTISLIRSTARHSTDGTSPASPVTRRLRAELLLRQGSNADGKENDLLTSLQLMRAMQPGEESTSLELLDRVLQTLASDAMSRAEQIGDPDGFVILRPILQHAILPDDTSIVAPHFPDHFYLKATTTLRGPPPGHVTVDESKKRLPGFPLPADWLFHPINELLHSATSVALQQAPPGWNPTETAIVRATLLLVQSATQAGLYLSRSTLLFNLQKVYMLEHQTSAAVSTDESELFRDDVVAQCLRELIAPLTTSDEVGEPVADLEIGGITRPRSSLEEAAQPYLGLEPYYQFYTDLLTLFESSSFGDPTFAQIILPPLSMTYPADYRKLVWSNPNILRLIRTMRGDVPLEDGQHGIRVFFEPVERDPEVLSAYGQALVRGWTREGQGLTWLVAVHHLASFLWDETIVPRAGTDGEAETDENRVKVGSEATPIVVNGGDDEQDEVTKALKKLREGLMRAVFRSAPQAVQDSLMIWTAQRWVSGNVDQPGREEAERRRRILHETLLN